VSQVLPDSSSSSLQSRATAALLRLAALDQKQQTDAETSAIENARSRAEATLGMLDDAVATAEALVGLSVPLVPLDARRRKDAAESRRALRTAAAAFLDPDTPLTNRLNGTSVQGALKQAQEVAAALGKLLNASVEAERVRLRPADMDNPVPDVPNKMSVYVKVKAAQRTLETSVENRVVSDLAAVVRHLRESAGVWADLRPELEAAIAELPTEVRRFVETASGEEGVAWAELTPAVRAWLDEGDHGETYRVRRW
jgi:hypothetical protein